MELGEKKADKSTINGMKMLKTGLKLYRIEQDDNDDGCEDDD